MMDLLYLLYRCPGKVWSVSEIRTVYATEYKHNLTVSSSVMTLKQLEQLDLIAIHDATYIYYLD